MLTTQLAKWARAWAAGLLLAAGSGWLLAAMAKAEEQTPAGKPPASYKPDLTPGNAQQLLELVRPHGDEWRHLQVQWLTDVVAARKRAAAEDKPIVICYTGGAGYNEPLGVC